MRRRIVAMSIATVVVAAAPCAAFAAVSGADQKSPKVVDTVTDAKGDVVAKMGTLKDMSASGSAATPFKPGTGTTITPSADDNAIDLSKVTYTVVRTGAKPSLRITYVAKGPFSRSDKTHETATSYEEDAAFDGFETDFAKGFNVSIDNEPKKPAIEFDNKADKKQKCSGLTGSLKSGAHTATLSLPLSCLSAAGVKASQLTSEAAHVTMDIVETVTDSGSVSEDDSVTVAADKTGKSRDLPLTPYKK